MWCLKQLRISELFALARRELVLIRVFLFILRSFLLYFYGVLCSSVHDYLNANWVSLYLRVLDVNTSIDLSLFGIICLVQWMLDFLSFMNVCGMMESLSLISNKTVVFLYLQMIF